MFDANGEVSLLTSTDTTAATAGNDLIAMGDGDATLIGGLGVDNVTAGTGSKTLLGDAGELAYIDGVLVSATSTQTGLGGDDVLSLGEGDTVVMGGDGKDSITAGNGTHVVLGDSGDMAWDANGVMLHVRSTATDEGDDLKS